MLTRRYQILLLITVVLAVYYPAVLAGVSKIDDYSLFTRLEQSSGWNLWSVFFPSHGGGGYYRPLVDISFRIDKYLLGLQPGLMHLENILIHITNAVLVYMLTLHLVSSSDRSKSPFPLMTALLFGLHPVNSESVNWISGRFDLLAGAFVLLSALFLLRYKEHNSKKHLAVSLGAFFCAVLSKETALAFLPGAFFLISSHDQEDRTGCQEMKSSRWNLRSKNNLVMVGVMAVVFMFFIFRSAAFTSNSSRIGMTIRFITVDWIHSMFVCLRALGFYMKKLVMPVPLNLAIMEVDPLYQILAVPLVALCGYIALRRTTISAFFITGIFLTVPAYLLAFGQIAWTPYAERYIYISSAFIITAAGMYMGRRLMGLSIMGMTVAFSVIVGVMFATTLSRSIVWQNDFLLVKDTVDKSPHSRAMRSVYASMLIGRGEYDEALVQLKEGSSFPLIGVYDETYDTKRAFIAAKQGRIDESIALYTSVLEKKRHSIEALRKLASLYEFKKDESSDAHERHKFGENALSYNIKLYDLTHDPYLLFKIGNDAASLGQSQKALSFYRKTFDSMRPEDPNKLRVRKQITRFAANEKHERIKNNK